ncbi:glycosyltransferase [Clostridium perfringens]|uniref:glycosyltransferase n=1 Tax=Clostridium perfringens TaxID=1502 RepID=UPI0013E3029E|nr:glycosyltransferase [Clostridium perfringens]NGU66461.1 glycosyltransferase [Clostridium perfringens]
MKKLLFFIPTLTGGGAEKVLINLVNNIDKSKFSVTVLTLFNVGVNRKNLNKNIEYKYIFNRIFRGNIYLLKIFSPKFLYKYMIKDKYDVIISYLQGPTTRIISGCPYDSKIVAWVHTDINSIRKIKSSYRNENEVIRCYSKYDSIVFVAKTIKKSFVKTFSNLDMNYKVLYNTLDIEMIKCKSLEAIEEINYDSNKINIISTGRFTHVKGYERLLEIVAKLINYDKLNIHLYLLGCGELENKYKEIITKNNITNNVTLLGYRDNPYKFVKNSDLFVCSSYREGYSTAVTESVIVGTPVITTLCSGMEEILGKNNEYGIIVKNEDEALYTGLKVLLKDRKKIIELKNKTIERSKFFDKNSTVKAVEDFIESL